MVSRQPDSGGPGGFDCGRRVFTRRFKPVMVEMVPRAGNNAGQTRRGWRDTPEEPHRLPATSRPGLRIFNLDLSAGENAFESRFFPFVDASFFAVLRALDLKNVIRGLSLPISLKARMMHRIWINQKWLPRKG